jgi:polyisoprenyl-teichoic acid--peptidoglycan teichoic acid transferase
VIDIDPGYQKLCGKDALAYVRYRHGDNDLVRGARQQDFLRQVRSAKGTKKLRSGGIAPGNLKRLARVFGRYFDRDKTLDNKKEVFKFAKTVLFTADNPVREVRFRVTDAPDRVNLIATESMLKQTVSEFMNAKASATARQQTEPTKADIAASKQRAKRRRNKPSQIKGLEEARAEGENQAIVGARKIDFPFYFPTLRTSTAAYQGQEPRTYKIRDERRKKHDAYRLVLAKGIVGEYYGIQGMTWRHPPILDDPHDTVVRNGRKLLVYRDGKRIRLVAWRTRKAVYWVSNTLTQSLSGPQMLGIATSLKRLG